MTLDTLSVCLSVCMSVSLSHMHTHTHTHTYICTIAHIYACTYISCNAQAILFHSTLLFELFILPACLCMCILCMNHTLYMYNMYIIMCISQHAFTSMRACICVHVGMCAPGPQVYRGHLSLVRNTSLFRRALNWPDWPAGHLTQYLPY